MEDSFYNLSLGFEGEAMSEDWVYDQKGWTVFIQEGDERTPLIADQFGGFTGLKESGQTFYFSRKMTETLDSPTLRLDVANRTIAVFLDGELLYTDCPDLDNRIGYLTLPMLDWDRTEPVVISLPLDYTGKTLTVAQSTGLGEKQEMAEDSTVWPCSINLYCGYSYESNLISESFQIAIPAAFCFGGGILLLSAFLWKLFSGKRNWNLLFLALTTFLWSSYQISSSSFVGAYFGILPIDMATLSRLLSLTVLLLFFTSCLTGIRRLFLGFLSTIQGICVLIYVILDVNEKIVFSWNTLPEWIGFIGLISVLGSMAWEWRKKKRFPHLFCLFVCLGFVALIVCVLANPMLRHEIIQQLLLGSCSYFLWKLMVIMLPSAVLTALIELITEEITRRTDARLLLQQYELAQSGFERLRRHQEEVQMLRHDMAKHLSFLRQSTSDKTTAHYLDELIGQQQAVSPVVQSRNQSLDIILNAKLSEAHEKGISVKIVQLDVPVTLPLSDAELCALLMNLLDNAINAAAVAKKPYIHLDFHQKDGFFVFVCENAVAENPHTNDIKKQTVLHHGLGLRIIRQIVRRYGDLMEIEKTPNIYRVTIALPLN